MSTDSTSEARPARSLGSFWQPSFGAVPMRLGPAVSFRLLAPVVLTVAVFLGELGELRPGVWFVVAAAIIYTAVSTLLIVALRDRPQEAMRLWAVLFLTDIVMLGAIDTIDPGHFSAVTVVLVAEVYSVGYMFRPRYVMLVAAAGCLATILGNLELLASGDLALWLMPLCVLLAGIGAAFRARGDEQLRLNLASALDAARESEGRYRDLFENATEMVVVLGMDGTILAANRAAFQLLGYEGQEMIGRSGLDIVHPDYVIPVGERRARVLRGEPPEPLQIELLHAGGEYIPVEINTRVMYADGQAVGFQAVARDIRQRLAAERALVRQNDYLAALHETSLDLMARREPGELLAQIVDRAATLVGADGGYILLQDAETGLLDVSIARGELNGIALQSLAPGEGLGGRVFMGGAPLSIADYGTWEGHVVHPRSATVHAMAAVPLHSGEEVVGVIGLCRTAEIEPFAADDIDLLERFARLASIALDNARLHASASRELAERTLREAELRESEERYRELWEGANDILFTLDREGRFTSANRAAEATSGYDREALLTMSVYDFTWPETAEAVRAALGAMAGGESPTLVVPVEIAARDGKHIFLELNARAIVEDGRAVGFQCNARDITERKRAEEALIQAQKLESLGVMAGGIAHDFNNLLVAIKGNAELGLFDAAPDSPVERCLRDIDVASQRAADLARQMLAYAGQGSPVVQPHALNAIVEEMTGLLRSSTGNGTIITLALAEHLPAVEGDATQLRQVVMNLVMNASEAIGDVPGHIRISTSVLELDREFLRSAVLAPDLPGGSYVCLEVEDTGSGMDRETLARIFDPFFTTRFAGRGLGLAAVLGIVRAHRGAIHVESKPGRGTRFQLIFPPSARRPVRKPTPLWPHGVRAGRGRVLVVDDEESVRLVTARALEHLGFEPILAAGGAEAVTIFAANPARIACVLLDMTMPGMNGAETFEAIRAIDPEASVVLTSGYPEQTAIARFHGKGLRGFIQKPYDLAVLGNTLSAAMRRAAAA